MIFKHTVNQKFKQKSNKKQFLNHDLKDYIIIMITK